jgi:hypothetical protein
MKKILVAVDDSKGSENAVSALTDLYSCSRPETVVLLYVEKIEGRSLMDEMLGKAEMSTLKEELKGTEHQFIPQGKTGRERNNRDKTRHKRRTSRGCDTGLGPRGKRGDDHHRVTREEAAHFVYGKRKQGGREQGRYPGPHRAMKRRLTWTLRRWTKTVHQYQPSIILKGR